jgi:CRISPR-associated protein Cmr1
VATTTVRRPYIPPTTTFDLQFRWTDTTAAEWFLASLWLLCAYGGIGARTRRGLGTIRIKNVDGPLPGAWADDRPRYPGKGYYGRLDHLPLPPIAKNLSLEYRYQQENRILTLTADGWDGAVATYPVLGGGHTVAAIGGREWTSWEETLSDAGQRLREARATEVSKVGPGGRYEQRRTPEWLRVIKGNDDHFPLGALGLPVVYPEGNVVNADRGPDELRRSSPLWLRPTGGGNDPWRLLSFAFHNEFLPADVSVHLWRTGTQDRDRQLHITHDDVVQRTQRWITERSQDRDSANRPRKR